MTIALGLGLLCSAFTFFDAYVLRPLAVRDPHRLYEIGWRSLDGRAHRFTWDQFRAIADSSDIFEGAFAYTIEAGKSFPNSRSRS